MTLQPRERRMSALEIKAACQQLLDEVRRAFPTTENKPMLTLIHGGGNDA
jgi:hypothetical protein